MSYDTIKFSLKISEILENDYGDFMRPANLYLNGLRNDLKLIDDIYINQKINQMQCYLQFAHNWNIESTRKLLERDIHYINDLLLGHRQDWESENLYTDSQAQ
jgi:hypothetical protein